MSRFPVPGLLLALVGLLALGAITASSAQAISLTKPEAEKAMRKVLMQESDFYYGDSYARYVNCNQRRSLVRIGCKMSWFIGDVGFAGRGAVWVSDTVNDLGQDLRAVFRVTRYDEYCEYVMDRKTSSCRKRFVRQVGVSRASG